MRSLKPIINTETIENVDKNQVFFKMFKWKDFGKLIVLDKTWGRRLEVVDSVFHWFSLDGDNIA